MTHFFVCYMLQSRAKNYFDSNTVWLFVTRSTLSIMSHIITNIFHSIWQVEKAFVCVHAPHWTALVCGTGQGADQHLWLLPLAQHCTSQHSAQPPDTFQHQSVSSFDTCQNWIAQMILIKHLSQIAAVNYGYMLYTHSMKEVFCLQKM